MKWGFENKDIQHRFEVGKTYKGTNGIIYEILENDGKFIKVRFGVREKKFRITVINLVEVALDFDSKIFLRSGKGVVNDEPIKQSRQYDKDIRSNIFDKDMNILDKFKEGK